MLRKNGEKRINRMTNVLYVEKKKKDIEIFPFSLLRFSINLIKIKIYSLKNDRRLKTY